MATESFTVEQFEKALPRHKVTNAPLWVSLGFKNGEYTYQVILPEMTPRIEVRSSIGINGVARGTGQDSIRAWIVDAEGNPLGSKIQKYVTRVSGWDRRLLSVLRDLAHTMKQIKPCPKCSKLMGVFKVKKEGPNKGRLFSSCSKECNQFTWLSKSCIFKE